MRFETHEHVDTEVARISSDWLVGISAYSARTHIHTSRANQYSSYIEWPLGLHGQSGRLDAKHLSSHSTWLVLSHIGSWTHGMWPQISRTDRRVCSLTIVETEHDQGPIGKSYPLATDFGF